MLAVYASSATVFSLLLLNLNVAIYGNDIRILISLHACLQ